MSAVDEGAVLRLVIIIIYISTHAPRPSWQRVYIFHYRKLAFLFKGMSKKHPATSESEAAGQGFWLPRIAEDRGGTSLLSIHPFRSKPFGLYQAKSDLRSTRLVYLDLYIPFPHYVIVWYS